MAVRTIEWRERPRRHARPAAAADARGLSRLPRPSRGRARHQGHGRPRRAGDRRRRGHGHRARRARRSAPRDLVARLRPPVPHLRRDPPDRGEPLLGDRAHASRRSRATSIAPSTRCARCSSARRSRSTTRTSPPTVASASTVPRCSRTARSCSRTATPGALATAGYGTALGVIRAARESGQAHPGDRLRDPAVPPGRAAHRVGAEEGSHPGHADHRQHGGPLHAARARSAA